ncbi:MAG: hypothetical protein C0600_06695 [Ignavibacteria bacterium]|nr:MAG: hypothetical protein C0600_06695 [Ignavibacteria bacterium]
MSTMKPCYDREQYDYGRCVIRGGYHEVIGTKSSNPDKCITVLIPFRCLPEQDDSTEVAKVKHRKAIELFKKLREETCICYLVLPAATDFYYPAIMAGWEKRDIILQVYSLSVDRLHDYNNEVDEYMSKMGIEEPQSFRAVYMDEPQNIEKVDYSLSSFKTIKQLTRFHYYVNNVFKSRFIISNYTDHVWSDHRKDYAQYCDEIIDNGYGDDFDELADSVHELGSKTLLFSMSNLYPEEVPGIQLDPRRLREYFKWANDLPVTGVWLWFGEYHDCHRFMNDLKIACKEAARAGWATSKEVFIETGKRYCKYSDCSKCLGHSYLEDDYWQDEPIGPPCPPAEYERDTELRTQSVAQFIYSQYSFR